MADIKKCPCGETPEAVFISGEGQGGKWAMVTGSCCGEWSIEFKTQYHKFDTAACMDLAVASWNAAPRAGERTP